MFFEQTLLCSGLIYDNLYVPLLHVLVIVGLSSEISKSSWILFCPKETAGLSLDLLGSWELPELWLTASAATVPFSLCQVIAI